MVTVSTINRLSRAVDLLENRSQWRPLRIVEVRRGYEEDSDAALDRHYAAHPEDRGGGWGGGGGGGGQNSGGSERGRRRQRGAGAAISGLNPGGGERTGKI